MGFALAAHATIEHPAVAARSQRDCENLGSRVRPILLFLSYSYVKSHLDNDSRLPIYKTIPEICNTPRQTQFVWNYIFPHFVMVITVLWVELWFVVVP